MAVTSTPDPSPSDDWVRAPEARQRLIAAAIDLLREGPFPKATVRGIAERAGLNPQSLMRNFGSINGLFDAVAKELTERSRQRAAATNDLDLLLDPDHTLRTRLLAWLLGEGLDPSTLRADPAAPIHDALDERRQQYVSVGPRTNYVFGEIILFLAEGFAVFSDTHRPFAPSDLADALALIADLRAHLPEAEARLGWSSSPQVRDDPPAEVPR